MSDRMAAVAMNSSMVAKSQSLFSPSQRQIEASSQVGYHDQPSGEAPKTKVIPLENTYKMKPDRKFEVAPIEKLINEVLKQQLEEEEYNSKSSRQMTKTLSTIITNRVTALKYERYKFVTIVTVGEIANQGVRVASRCVMDQETDNFASGSYKNASLFGVATVYAFYYE